MASALPVPGSQLDAQSSGNAECLDIEAVLGRALPRLCPSGANAPAELAVRLSVLRCWQATHPSQPAGSTSCPSQQVPPAAEAGFVSNCRHILQLAAELQDHQARATAAAALAEHFAAAGDAAAAADRYADCLQACRAAADSNGSSSSSSSQWVQELLIQIVPSAVDVHLSLGSPAGAREVLSSYNLLLLAAGRSAAEECAVCYEPLTGAVPVTLLSCGHLFHQSCCNEWIGHRLFEVGQFSPECPLCRAVDDALQPSETALKALEELQQYYAAAHGSSSSSDDGSSSEDGSSDAGDESGSEAMDASEPDGGWNSSGTRTNEGTAAAAAAAAGAAAGFESAEMPAARLPLLPGVEAAVAAAVAGGGHDGGGGGASGEGMSDSEMELSEDVDEPAESDDMMCVSVASSSLTVVAAIGAVAMAFSPTRDVSSGDQ